MHINAYCGYVQVLPCTISGIRAEVCNQSRSVIRAELKSEWEKILAKGSLHTGKGNVLNDKDYSGRL